MCYEESIQTSLLSIQIDKNEKRLKTAKRKYFNQLLVVRSIQKLVKIYNTPVYTIYLPLKTFIDYKIYWFKLSFVIKLTNINVSLSDLVVFLGYFLK